ncbi:MAG: DNA polymerase III subunit epsilon, partial [Roseovarius sp.]|nr:DNA polymerase III subunit epsilon [Roseovarius sp.]
MEIIFYQGLVFVTLVLVRVFAKNYLEVACWVWTALTLINLFWPPLIVLQLIVVWGTYGVIRPKAATVSQAESVSPAVRQLQPQANKAKQRSGDSAHGPARVHAQHADKAQSSQRKTGTLTSTLADKSAKPNQSFSWSYSGKQPISSSEQRKLSREIVLDIETTGLDPETGDRIVEIGAVELIGHIATGRTYHHYINPDRAMPDEAFAVHGLGDDFLRDKPRFDEIVHTFLKFIGDAPLVIHNASFEMKFINAELVWMKLPLIPWERAIDTLALARSKFPDSPATLDALCRRFGIDISARTLHGTLLDSEILAEVYLELIGGRQRDFD